MKTKVSLLVAVLFVMGCFAGTLLAKTSREAAEEIKASAKAKGLSDADARTSVSVLSELVDKGVPVDHALAVVTAAIDRKNSGPEIAAIAKSLGETVEKEGSAKEIAAIARMGVEKGLKGREIGKVMANVQASMGKDASARQLRILTKDLLDNGSDVDGLSVAIEAVGNSVANGYSPEESRKSVALVALKGIKSGLRGEALAAEIRKEAQRGKGVHGETRRERTHERKTPEDVKERMKTPGGTSEPGTGSSWPGKPGK